ncbi:MAG: DUF547 domain-containing protein [Cyclobacteriaceae bacterium]|nr:DUF547 domain-containing protein [Cyclobacteriaceae bacterium HetDA_MAG_MS6]
METRLKNIISTARTKVSVFNDSSQCQRQKIAIWLLLTLPLIACGKLNPTVPGTHPVSHAQFDQLLAKFVDDEGRVDYQELAQNRADLQAYLQLLQDNAPNDESWSRDEKLAYWINAYNAFTLELILRHYPISSIKDIGGAIQIPFVNSPWDIKFIEIGGKKYDLNNIEHQILRKLFDEPRIHFAINCASFSCPKLRKEAYSAKKIEEQLQSQAVAFINDPDRNIITEEKMQISKIFRWFKGDFTKQQNLIVFLNQFTEVQLTDETEVSYLDYNWQLNE